jgi:hypothetical protein
MNIHKDQLIDRQNGREFTLSLEDCAKLLGGEVDGDFILFPSPGQPADDRSCCVRINLNTGQPYVYDCDDELIGAAYAYVRGRLGLATFNKVDHYPQARGILNETVIAAGTIVETYLRSRAITIPIPPCLHFHHRLYYSPDKSWWPGMVAERTNVSGTMVAIHRTYLARDGKGKAPVKQERMDLGTATSTAIRLSPVAEELMVGEGIETTLSAMEMYGLPGWAAGSAYAIRSLELPVEVRSVIILVDNDVKGRNASTASAQRWLREKRRVRTSSSDVGNDFNDALRARRAAS